MRFKLNQLKDCCIIWANGPAFCASPELYTNSTCQAIFIENQLTSMEKAEKVFLSVTPARKTTLFDDLLNSSN